MSVHVIARIYSFLGFHLCKHLLESGEEVLGIDLEEGPEGIQHEMSLYFGRNANFRCISYRDPINVPAGKVSLYMNLYDKWYNALSGKHLEQLEEWIAKEEELRQVSILLPSLCQDSISPWLREIRGQVAFREIWIDPLYGPWMSDEVLAEIQAACDAGESSAIDRLMYIDDFLGGLPGILQSDEEKVLVVSEQSQSIAEFRKKAAIEIKRVTTIQEGLNQIKEHAERLRMLEKWKGK